MRRPPTQADITVAVAWRFTHHTGPGLVDDSDYPTSPASPAQAEGLPAFRAVFHRTKAPMIGRITGRLAENPPQILIDVKRASATAPEVPMAPSARLAPPARRSASPPTWRCARDGHFVRLRQ